MMTFDLVAHLKRAAVFSKNTFGPGPRAAGVVAHIREELLEIERDPNDISEWIDVAILAFDGALRQGFTPEAVAAALEAKQTKNEGRKWPDWRQFTAGQPINHVREEA